MPKTITEKSDWACASCAKVVAADCAGYHKSLSCTISVCCAETCCIPNDDEPLIVLTRKVFDNLKTEIKSLQTNMQGVALDSAKIASVNTMLVDRIKHAEARVATLENKIAIIMVLADEWERRGLPVETLHIALTGVETKDA